MLKWKKVAVIGGIVGGIGVGVLIARRAGLLGVKFTFNCDRQMIGCQWWNAWGTLKDWRGLVPIVNHPIEILGRVEGGAAFVLARVTTDTKGNYTLKTFFDLPEHQTTTEVLSYHFWARTTIGDKEYKTPELPVEAIMQECTGPCRAPPS